MGIISRFPAGATKPYIEEIYNSDGQLIDAKMYGYEAIRDYAFYACENLALTTLPSGITNIGNSAFAACTNLALTTLPSGITNIDDYAFVECSSLVSLTFEGTPENIGASAFADCNNLTTINVPWAEGAVANAPWGAENATINYGYTG